MAGLIERGLLLGLGALTLSREKVTRFVDKLIEEGEVKPEEAPGVIDRLVNRGEEERKELRRLVRQELDKTRASVTPVTRQEVKALNQRMDELAEKLDSLSVEKPAGK